MRDTFRDRKHDVFSITLNIWYNTEQLNSLNYPYQKKTEDHSQRYILALKSLNGGHYPLSVDIIIIYIYI